MSTISERRRPMLDIYSTTVLLGDADLTTTMDVSFFSHSHDWNAVLHEHSFHELFFLVDGCCSIRIEDAFYDFGKNDIIWVPQGLSHYVSHVNASTRLYSMGVVCAQRQCRTGAQSIYKNFLDLSRHTSTYICLPDAVDVINLMQAIRIELSNKRFGFVEQVNAYLSLLYMSILRKWLGVPPSIQSGNSLLDLDVDPSTLEPESRRQYDEMVVIVWFFRHYMEKFTIADVAGSLNMSISQTNRFIKQLYGMGFAQKLTLIRMGVAQNLLMKTTLSTEQIAEAVGFTSYNGFFVAFKKHTSLSPAAFRQLVQRKDNNAFLKSFP